MIKKPEQLAYDFCLQNNLDFDSMQSLTEEIKNALSNYKNEPNHDLKNQISEEAEQLTSDKKKLKNSENEISPIENHEEDHEVDHEENQGSEEYHHEDNNENDNLEQHEHEHNLKNESGKKTEELSEENHDEGENQNQENQEKEEIHSDVNENENNQEHESENEHEHEQEHEEENDYHLEGKKEQNKNKDGSENAENLENHDDNLSMTEKDIVHHSNNENENENEKIEKNEKKEKNEKNEKNEENEEELAKEEERDEMMDMNENEEEEAIPSYLSPTICFQYKQRQIAQPKPKPEFSDFDTTYKRKDKTEEFVSELHEEVINHLIINQNNQKYLPKDYYDNPNGQNFGERLYHKQTKLKEETMEKIRNKVEKENKAKEDNLTFTPKINDYNIVALQNRIKNKQQYNDENKIIHYKDYLMGKEDKIKYKYYDPENTFMPKIDKNSRKMTEGRTNNVPRYEQLYKTKVDKKKLEKKIYDEKNMFKPKTNKNYKPERNGKAGTSQNKKMAEYASLTFEERQKKFVEKVEEKREKLKEQKNTNIDTKTGKKYFKPTINKNKKLDDERKNKPIYIELYSDSEKYKIKKEELEKKVLELEQFNTEFKASVRSEELYDKQKNIAFEKVFKRLDSDKDGKISNNNIDLYGISKRILKIITPILDELKSGKGTISLEEFVQKCEKIYGNLNYADKKELFIYTMGGAIKSVYDTEPFRRKQIQRKSKGKTVRSTSKTNNLKKKNFHKELKQSHVK